MAAKKASPATARAGTPRATSTTKPASGRRTSARAAQGAAEGARGKSKATSAHAAGDGASSKQVSGKGSSAAGAAKKTTPVKAPSKKATTSAARTKPSSSSASSAAAPTSELREGERAPSFALQDQQGEWVRSKDLEGAPYVLYFYPKDNTPGCTREACDFRDAFGAFKRRKIRVFGVSPDSAKSHANFVAKYELPFPLLVDADKELAAAYGVWAKKKNYGREYFGVVRSTFLVDAKGVVRKAWRGVRVPGHVDDVLSATKELR